MFTKEQLIQVGNQAVKAMQHSIDSQVMAMQNYATTVNDMIRQAEERERKEKADFDKFREKMTDETLISKKGKKAK
jgi:hypothetical protein